MPVTEVSDLQPKTFSFEWKIKHFYADCKKIGHISFSPIFQLNYPNKGTKWWLEVSINSGKEKNKNSISLYLCYESLYYTDVTADYRLTIVGKQESLSRLVKAYTFTGLGDRYGWYEFVKEDFIKDPENGVLIDDTLTISCEITFHPPSQNVPEELKDYDNIINKLGAGIEQFEELMENNLCSDVTFYIQDKIMHLHRVILMRRSSVFHAMFERDVKEKKESIVRIKDVDWDVMEELFRFIYSEKIQDFDDYMAEALVIAADKYAVTELKALCERKLFSDLNVNNAIKYLKLTNKYNSIHLKSLTVKFVVDHYNDLVGKSEFEFLPKKIMCDIFRALAVKS